MTLLGMIYQMMKSGMMDTLDGSTLIEEMTIFGSQYRPVDESDV